MTSSSILIRLSYKTVGQYTDAQLRNINEIPRAPAVYIQPIFILIACMFQSFIWLYGRQIIGWCFFIELNWKHEYDVTSDACMFEEEKPDKYDELNNEAYMNEGEERK